MGGCLYRVRDAATPPLAFVQRTLGGGGGRGVRPIRVGRLRVGGGSYSYGWLVRSPSRVGWARPGPREEGGRCVMCVVSFLFRARLPRLHLQRLQLLATATEHCIALYSTVA